MTINNKSNLLKSKKYKLICEFIFLCIILSSYQAMAQMKEYKLGEQQMEFGRNHPRVSESDDSRWYKRVGPSINLQTSKNGKVDVVIQTFTGEKGDCKTLLGEAGGPYTKEVVTQRINFGPLHLFNIGDVEEFKLESNSEMGSSWGKFLRHRAAFSDLTQGTYYHYKVECQNQDDPKDLFGNEESVFRAPPPPNDSKDTQLMVVSDYLFSTHPSDYGDKDGEPSNEWKNQVREQSYIVSFLLHLMTQGNLDFVVLPGDIIQNGKLPWVGTGGSYFGYLTRYHSQHELIAAGIPMFPVPGNHDVIDWAALTNCRQSLVRKFFDMMATPHSRDEEYKNQWWSFDWGSTHVVGLDLVFEQGQSEMRKQAQDCGLSRFEPGSVQRKWLWKDIEELDSHSDMKWRIIVQHGSPKKVDSVQGEVSGKWDPFGPCGLDGEYKNYCSDINQLNIDLILTGHSGFGLRRHLFQGGNADDIAYSFRQNNSIALTHLRMKSDSIIVSRINIPRDTPKSTRNGLFECYKYIPGVKKERIVSAFPTLKTEACDTSTCKEKEYTLKRIIKSECTSTSETLMASVNLTPKQFINDGNNEIEDKGVFLVPCCKSPDPTNDDVCFDAAGKPVSKTVTISIQECERQAIKPGCLRRQVVPVAINTWENAPPHITNSDLLKECTPCQWEDIGGKNWITGYEFCGQKPDWSSDMVPIVEYLLNISP